MNNLQSSLRVGAPLLPQVRGGSCLWLMRSNGQAKHALFSVQVQKAREASTLTITSQSLTAISGQAPQKRHVHKKLLCGHAV